MKPAPFDYRRPTTLEEATATLADLGDEAAILAGGQSLIPLLNLRLARPEVVVDINRVEGLDRIDITDTEIRVGALVRAATLERDAAAAAASPVLIEAVRQVAHPQIRNRTTIGGNIAHSDPSSELPGVLSALDGSVTLTSVRGDRTVGWADFFHTVFTTAKEDDEMVTSVVFPRHPGWCFTFREVARRRGDYPIAGLCVGLRLDGGVITGARLAAVAIADRPVRLSATEAALTGMRAEDRAGLEAVRAGARDEVEPTDDIHGTAQFRRSLVGTLLGRCVDSLIEGAAA